MFDLTERPYTRLHREGLKYTCPPLSCSISKDCIVGCTERNSAASLSRLISSLSLFVKLSPLKLQSMELHHSALELVNHDETARAPERDWDATAFELDTSALAPQVSKTEYLVRTYSDQRSRLC